MGLAVIPTWAAPADQAIRDAHRIAVAVARTQDHPTMRAVGATLGWITGCAPSPLTRREVRGAVPIGEARGELTLAQAVGYGATHIPADMWAGFGVTPARSCTDDRQWAGGVEATLAWLLGLREACPVPLPARRPDGELCTAEDLYRERLDRLGRHPVHERKREVWAEARAEAARSAQLAELAASV